MNALTRRSLVAGSAFLNLSAASSAPLPNVLWVSCEDTGPQLGCYGDPGARTPALDRLAAGGVRYTRAFSVAGVCAPSRSGIITGMYPSSLGSQYMRCSVTLPDFIRCFPEYLREAGYFCTNNAKTDYNFPPPKAAWDELGRHAHWRNRPKGRPFFAVFNIETTHESRVRLRGEEYAKATARLKEGDRRDPSRLTLPAYYPDTPEARRDWANYYELITAMDSEVADRLREVEDAGLLEDTIVCFWGDHGVGLPRAKRWIYEDSTHVPLIVRIPPRHRAPGQGAPGSSDDQLISLIDLGPTVLNLAGVPVPRHMQGRAFLGPNLAPRRSHVFCLRDRMDERYDTLRAVRDSRYRYIRNYHPQKPWTQHISYCEEGYVMKELRRLHAGGKLPAAAAAFMASSKPVEELYDAERDPHGLRNLASEAAHRPVLERMRKVLEQWCLETRDLGLIPESEVAEREKSAGTRYQILRRPDSPAYIRSLRALVDAANRGSDLALLRRSLQHPDPAFRFWALTGLGQNAGPEQSARMMGDSAAVVRVLAARLAGGEAAVDLLSRELAAPNEWTRLEAAIALDELGPAARAAVPALRKAAGDRNDYVTRVARHALQAIC